MRLFIVFSLATLTLACGESSSDTDTGSQDNLQTQDVNIAQTEMDAQAPLASDAQQEVDAGPDVEELPEDIPCELSPGMCPNACEQGESGQGEICVTDADCACGHCCGFGACQPFDAIGCEAFSEYAECLCVGETPGSDPVQPGEEPGQPSRVDSSDYIDDCDSLTPIGSTCNPFCQLGCPPGSHCALFDDTSFSCVTSGQGALNEACEHSGECGAWWSCFGTFDAEFDTCRQICDADEECPGGQACNLDIQLSSAVNVSFCDTAQITCDLWLPDCPNDMKCVAVAGKTICAESTWDGIEGYPCTELGDCASKNEAGDRMLCMSIDGCAPICSTADSLPLGAKSCAEMCPGGYTSVDINLDIGRCSSGGI